MIEYAELIRHVSIDRAADIAKALLRADVARARIRVNNAFDNLKAEHKERVAEREARGWVRLAYAVMGAFISTERCGKLFGAGALARNRPRKA